MRVLTSKNCVNLLHTKIVLASCSPQRSAILKEYGFSIEICPADIDETIHSAESPEKNAERLAREKAVAIYKNQKNALVLGADTIVAKKHPDAIVLGADTIVVSEGGEILTKAKTKAEARRMLENRSGTSEVVVTGWAICSPYGTVSGVEASRVFFKIASEVLIQEILERGEWRGVAGALRIEGEASSTMIERFEGSFANILGLPIETIADVLRHFPSDL